MKIATILNPNVKNALTKLFNAHLPVTTAFKVKRLVISIDAETEKFNGLRNSLIEELGSKTETGEVSKDEKGNVNFADDKKAEFFKREAEIKNMDFLVSPIKLTELGNIALSANDLFALEDIIKE